MQETAEILFEYLKDILYRPGEAKLEVEALPIEFQKLGRGMEFLADCVRENRTFAKALAKGDLSVQPPGAENVLAAPVKELQGSLRHLAWQTRQVAKGDYSQSVDFMGEFSQDFNTMIRQLKDRQEALIEEKRKVEANNRELERNLELVMALTNFTHNMIFVYSLEAHESLFFNDSAQWFMQSRPEDASKVLEQIRYNEKRIPKADSVWDMEIESEQEEGGLRTRYFTVESYHIYWRGQMAAVHIVMDDTERKNKENLMYKLAYVDPLTGLNNRLYAMDLMSQWMAQNEPFVMSFIDMDYLKYCNDTFGHKAGDEYLVCTANALKSLGCEVCRIGGDEFIMMRRGVTARYQDEKLSELRTMLENSSDSGYPQSFSFASSEVPAGAEMSLEDYIKLTDTRMYEYKMRNKKPLDDIFYKDQRI